MPTCRGCGTSFEAEDLKRHEREGIVIVHCPECGCALGSYNRHARDRA